MKLFNIDSPLMQFLAKVADLMIINILVLVCSIPIFTIGASLTAAHYVILKMVRKEDCYIVRSFFKSFKSNFKQATLIWLLMMLVFGVIGGDCYIIYKAEIEFNKYLLFALLVAGIAVVMTSIYVFPVLAKFDNTIKATIKHAFMMSIVQFPKTILMLIAYVAPVAGLIFWMEGTPVIMLLGISVPIFLAAFLYNKFFLQIEENILAAQAEAEGPKVEEDDPDRIFSDKLDETLIAQNMDSK